MTRDFLSLEEAEQLGYYDFMAYLQVPFFNIGGTLSIEMLAELCNIDEYSHVLDVGCREKVEYSSYSLGC